MADDKNPLSEKEANSLMSKVLTELRRSRAETTKGQVDAMKVFEDKLGDIKGLTDEQTTRAKRASMLEQSLNFDKSSAMELAKTTGELEMVRERLSSLKTLGEETGQGNDAIFQQEVRALQVQERQLEEEQKFGRSLGGLERITRSATTGVFKDINEAIKEGNQITGKTFGALKDDLRGDFDKVLGFFGPVAGLLQQIPFLGTIFNLLKRLTLKTLAWFVKTGKDFLTTRKEKKKVDKKNLEFQKKTLSAAEKRERKLKKDGSADMRFKENQQSVEVAAAEGPKMGDSFRGAAIFLGAAAATGTIAGAGLTSAAVGMSAFAAASFKFAAALAVGGIALGVGLTGVFGSFALGDRMGAFDGMQEFGKVNMLKVLGSMLGLATLMGVLGGIMTTGVGALIMGVGAIAVMGLIGTLVVVGKGLGEFANSITPFETLNIPRIKTNIQQLSSITGDISDILDSTKTFGLSQLVGQHPLEDLAAAINMYDQDMQVSISNLQSLKTALAGFKFPELPESEQGIGGWFMGLIGEDFVGELEDLSAIELTKSLGDNLGNLGDGLGKIGTGLDGITDTKVSRLERIQKAVSKMDSVVMNFGLVGSSTPIGPGMNQMMGNQAPITQINQPIANNQTNNMSQKRFIASGSNMTHHSALQYAGQLN